MRSGRPAQRLSDATHRYPNTPAAPVPLDQAVLRGRDIPCVYMISRRLICCLLHTAKWQHCFKHYATVAAHVLPVLAAHLSGSPSRAGGARRARARSPRRGRLAAQQRQRRQAAKYIKMRRWSVTVSTVKYQLPACARGASMQTSRQLPVAAADRAWLARGSVLRPPAAPSCC